MFASSKVCYKLTTKLGNVKFNRKRLFFIYY